MVAYTMSRGSRKVDVFTSISRIASDNDDAAYTIGMPGEFQRPP